MKLFLMAVCSGLAAAGFGETRVGIIGLDTSHAVAFTKIMNVDKDPGVAGFRVTTAYQWGSKDIFSSTNRYPKYLAEVRRMGVEVVPTLDELLAKVDVVCLETNDGREHLQQAEKVFKGISARTGKALSTVITADEEGFDRIVQGALRRAKDHVEGIRSGAAAPLPVRMGKFDSCRFCDLRECCLRDESIDQRRARVLPTMKPTDYMSALRYEEEESGGC